MSSQASAKTSLPEHSGQDSAQQARQGENETKRVSPKLSHILYFEDNDCFFAPKYNDKKRSYSSSSVDEKPLQGDRGD